MKPDDQIWLTLIAVVGTLAGTTVAPALKARRSQRQTRRDIRAAKATALREMILVLIDLASYGVRFTEDHADVKIASRAFNRAHADFSMTLQKGETPVANFVAGATMMMRGSNNEDERIAIVNAMSDQLFSWQRGDRRPTQLTPFQVTNVTSSGDYTLRNTSYWDLET